MELDMIRRVEMFNGLSDPELAKVIQLGKTMEYRPRDVIVRENATGGMLHLILEGEVEVRKRIGNEGERTLARLGAGSVFGEMSIFDGHPYSASVLAYTETRTFTLFRNDFFSLAEVDPGLAFKVTTNLICELSQKLRKTNENLVSLSLLHQSGSSQ